MKQATVVVIGGGATGTGILRDLCMRGISAVLLEQGDLASGTSSRFHGLLHSGARYAFSDPLAAKECITENIILRRIGASCVENTEGYFVRTPQDDPDFESKWYAACIACSIPVEQLSVEEARRREPNLTPDAQAVYRVPDAAVDGFRLVWHNAMSARRHGGEVYTYSRVTGIDVENGSVRGVRFINTRSGEQQTIACDFLVNATGSWAGEVAHLAGIGVDVTPDRGTLLAFNHRFTDRVINRLRKATDGDIFVPHGSITIFGTTSIPTNRPDDTAPRSKEVLDLLDMGEALFPQLKSYRMLRAFAGTRPLYSPDASTGRSATRNFVIIDHHKEGIDNMLSITGGKFTSFRLMAEKTCDRVAQALGVTTPCRTAVESIIPAPTADLMRRAKNFFPAAGLELAAARLGDDFTRAIAKAEETPWKKLLLCECELVTMAEFEVVASEPTSHSLGDIRRRTRLGMGTCQGSFCALRATGALVEDGLLARTSPQALFRTFLQERWHGIRPLLWGNQLREIELERGIYGATLNIDGDCGPESDTPGAGSACSAPALLKSGGPAATEAPAPTATMQEWSWVPPARPAQMPPIAHSYDVVVVGAGFTGLVAAAAAVRRGRRVLLISKGAGALSIGGGTVDILGYVGRDAVAGDPFAAMARLAPDHPYRLLGETRVRDSLNFLQTLADEAGYPLVQTGGESNVWMPTAAGTMKPSWLSSPSMNPASLAAAKSFTVLGLTGMKDFAPQLVAAGLAACPQFAGKRFSHATVDSPLMGTGTGIRDSSALDLARFIDGPEGHAWLRRALPKSANGSEALLIPSILGTRPDPALHTNLERDLGLAVVELFCPPPSVTGLRLKAVLMQAIGKGSIAFAEGATVTGAVVEQGRCKTLITGGPGNRRAYHPETVIMATGGLFSDGITTSPGAAHEAVFGLPVPMPAVQEDWSCPQFFGREPHAFASMGVRVDASLRPVDPAGDVLLENVLFAGRSLGGYDFATEKSGSGVALATGYAAGSVA